MTTDRPPHSSTLQYDPQVDGNVPQSLLLLPPTVQQAEEEEGGLNLGQVISAIKRRWQIVAVVTIAVTATTFFWSKTRSPLYEGSFELLVEPVTAESEVVSAIAGSKPSIEAQELGETQRSKVVIDYPTQIKILLSQKLLIPVAEKLERRLPGISYRQLENGLVIERLVEGQPTKIMKVRYRGSTPEEVKLILESVSEYYLAYSVTERQTNLRRALKFIDSQFPVVQSQVWQREQAIQKFRERYNLIDPANLSSEVSQRLSGLRSQELSNQLELRQSRQLYSALQSQLQLTPNSAEASAVLSDAPGFRQISDQLRDIETQLVAASAELTADHPSVIALQERREQLLPLLRQRAQQALGTQLFDAVKDSQSLPYQDSLRKSLSTRLVDASINLQVLETQKQAIADAKAALIQEISKVPSILRRYGDLQRQLQISSDNLGNLMRQREELQINAARQEAPWEIVKPPTLSQYASNLRRDMILGTMLGVLLGMGTAILADRIGGIIYHLEDLRPVVKQPILGLIPLRTEADSPVSSNLALDLNETALETQSLEEPLSQAPRYSFSPFLEAFRSLAAQVRLLNPDTPIKSLAISSSLPGEGKTTVALHLAQAAAALGQRVLLVDTDLRAPSLSHVLELPTSPGLSDIMSNNLSLPEAIHTIQEGTQISVLTAGIPPADPTSCLASQKMRVLANDCAEDYDLVIYDLPPLGLADSTIISNLTNGLMLVAKLGLVQRSNLEDKLHNLAMSKVPILGIVVNGMPENEFHSSVSSSYKAKSSASHSDELL